MVEVHATFYTPISAPLRIAHAAPCSRFRPAPPREPRSDSRAQERARRSLASQTTAGGAREARFPTRNGQEKSVGRSTIDVDFRSAAARDDLHHPTSAAPVARATARLASP